MKKNRKTFPVEALKERVNFLLANKDLPADQKKWVASLLEGVLLETGNYRGFSYRFDWGAEPSREERTYERYYH